MLRITQFCKDFAVKNVRLIHTTNIQLADHQWRRQNKLPRNPNTESPLTYLPDFSYLDGRPTPIGSNMRHRLIKQKAVAKRIVKGLEEIDFAEKRYIRIMQEDKTAKQKIMDSKLKPKGAELLKK